MSSQFPKAEAGRLAVAVTAVLRASGESMGPTMAALRKALQEYDDAVIELTRRSEGS